MFYPDILIGDVISEADVQSIFACQSQLGIRQSKKNNAIIIVSDARPNNRYADVWVDDILYYTGTDAGAINGNQTLNGTGNNNGALKAVWDNPDSTTLFLFVKYAQNQCTYKGVVRLAAEPYQEPRRSNPSQLVWKFPLRLVDVGTKKLEEDFSKIEKRATLQTEDDLKHFNDKQLNNPNRSNPVKRTATTYFYDRDPRVSAYVKARAHGMCDLCRSNAPFIDEDGFPYLESHHVKWLSRGGSDDSVNMVALCPNCHRKVHVLDMEEDVTLLKNRIKEYSLQEK